jgi:hypothetical protein
MDDDQTFANTPGWPVSVEKASMHQTGNVLGTGLSALGSQAEYQKNRDQERREKAQSDMAIAIRQRLRDEMAMYCHPIAISTPSAQLLMQEACPNEFDDPSGFQSFWARVAAKLRYMYADAMLAERDK